MLYVLAAFALCVAWLRAQQDRAALALAAGTIVVLSIGALGAWLDPPLQAPAIAATDIAARWAALLDPSRLPAPAFAPSIHLAVPALACLIAPGEGALRAVLALTALLGAGVAIALGPTAISVATASFGAGLVALAPQGRVVADALTRPHAATLDGVPFGPEGRRS